MDANPTNNPCGLNPFNGFAYREEIQHLVGGRVQALLSGWRKKEGNNYVGATAEALVKIYLSDLMKQYGLNDSYAITGNNLSSEKKYFNSRGLSFDLLISERAKTLQGFSIKKPVLAIEVRNQWDDRYVSKTQFDNRFLKPFRNGYTRKLIRAGKIIIHIGEKPIRFTFNQLNQLIARGIHYTHTKKEQLLSTLTNLILTLKHTVNNNNTNKINNLNNNLTRCNVKYYTNTSSGHTNNTIFNNNEALSYG